MEKKLLLAGVMLAALSLSGCNNNPGPDAKAAPKAASETPPHATVEAPAKPAIREAAAAPAPVVVAKAQPVSPHPSRRPPVLQRT